MAGAIAQDSHKCCNNQTILEILLESGVITPEDLKPVTADFEGAPTSGDAPLVVAFRDLSTDDSLFWSWNFGDGASSSAQNPSHTYSAAGTYTVALTVSGAGGTDTATKEGYITVTGPRPTAYFEGTPTSGDAPLEVAFSDLSTGDVSSRSWTFGDGAKSSAQNPSHTYSASGIYTVALTVSGPGGKNTATGVGYITVTEPPEGPDYALLSRDYLRAGLELADQKWSSPVLPRTGQIIFVEGSKALTEDVFAFAEYEEFSSSGDFIQDAVIVGAGWDTPLNDRAEACLKLGFAHLSDSYKTGSGGSVGGDRIDSLFIGAGVRYLLGKQLLGELEYWEGGDKLNAFSARIEWLVARYGFFLQSLSRGKYSGFRFGISLFL
jgi:PKD repeat protein